MNQQIKSHWKLAYRSFIKAIKVTLSVAIQTAKSYQYQLKNEERLLRQRSTLLKEYQEYLDKEM